MYQRLLLPGASSSRTSVDCENTIDVHSYLQKRQAAQEEPAAAAKAVHKPFPPALPADALRVTSESDEDSLRGNGSTLTLVFDKVL